jgi:hypothetical protein
MILEGTAPHHTPNLPAGIDVIAPIFFPWISISRIWSDPPFSPETDRPLAYIPNKIETSIFTLFRISPDSCQLEAALVTAGNIKRISPWIEGVFAASTGFFPLRLVRK